MKISFDNISRMDKNATPGMDRGIRTEKAGKINSYNVAVAFDGKDRVGFGTEPANKGKAKVAQMTDSAEEQVQNMRNQMTVMSHTMSDEDFAKLQEEGYDLSDLDPQEAVTILDKIKAELLKAGEYVEGYTDNIDRTTLAAAVGSETLAVALSECFQKQDIPLERQNVEQVLWALEIAKQIPVPEDHTYYYMAANGMEATLMDFYRASASGAKIGMIQNHSYFAEDVNGYITKNIVEDGEPVPDLEQEISRLLEKMGVTPDADEKEIVSWFVEKKLPVDMDGIRRMEEIFSVRFPLEPKQVIQSAVAAIADGVSVGERNLTDTDTYLEKAVRFMEIYQGESGLTLVQDRRQLEEIRLHMTVETNIKLLKSGFSIDTAPIEMTIEALKKAEQELAETYFPQVEHPEEKYRLYQETGNLLKELPGLPLATVGRWTEHLQDGTLQEFFAEGQQMAASYKAAGERYETIWTMPRADLGDSLKKAFANVDEILKDLNYEATEENRKAIRALGYNRMEMTGENVERVKQVQSSVEQIIRHMTPAATLKMIRDNVNPLTETLPELQNYFREQKPDYAQDAEKYSKFLYQLQKQGEISPEEKEAFIGCYRLIHQIEKSDGAAVAALVNTGQEINFRNLLSSIRSRNVKTMDVRIDETIGALSEEAVMKFSISEQINKGYAAERALQSREQSEQAARASGECYEMLERGEVTPSAQNLVAANALEQGVDRLFKGLRNMRGVKETKEEIWRKLGSKESFLKIYEEDLAEQKKLVETATIQESDSLLDVQSKKLMHKQLHIMKNLVSNEEYFFPMEIAGQVTGIHLQFTHSETMQSLIHLTMESNTLGKLSGYLQVTTKGVEGYFVGNKQQAVMNLKNASDIISNSIRKEWKFCEIDYIYNETNHHIPMDWTRRSAGAETENSKLYSLAKDFLESVKAVGDRIEER